MSLLDSNYNTNLTLKSIRDRTFGCGVVQNSNEMYLMNSRILMKMEIDGEKISSFDTKCACSNLKYWLQLKSFMIYRLGGGKLIKSLMTQAILYGSNPEVMTTYEVAKSRSHKILESLTVQLST